MSFWGAIVAIVAIIAFTELLKSRNRTKHGITTDEMGHESPIARENSDLKREIEDLHERIKVLERIATDDRQAKRLSAEIDALRDAEEIEERSKP